MVGHAWGEWETGYGEGVRVDDAAEFCDAVQSFFCQLSEVCDAVILGGDEFIFRGKFTLQGGDGLVSLGEEGIQI